MLCKKCGQTMEGCTDGILFCEPCRVCRLDNAIKEAKRIRNKFRPRLQKKGMLKEEQIIITQDTERHISGGQSSANKRETGGDNATDFDKCEPMKQSIAEGIMSPKQKTEQIERGENWIVEFWRVRGFEIIKTVLGISFSLHRKPEFENRGLGLDLTYLEQFAEEAIKRGEK